MAAFVEYHGPIGNIVHARLPDPTTTTSCFLPDQVNDSIHLTPFRNCNTHSTVRLQPRLNYVLLSVWYAAPKPVYILHQDGISIEVPVSMFGMEIAFILTHGHQFVTPASRWKIDLSHVENVATLMEPPPIPFPAIDPKNFSAQKEITSVKINCKPLQITCTRLIESTAVCPDASDGSIECEENLDPTRAQFNTNDSAKPAPTLADSSPISTPARPAKFEEPRTPQLKLSYSMDDVVEPTSQVSAQRTHRKKVRFDEVITPSKALYKDMQGSLLFDEQNSLTRRPGAHSPELPLCVSPPQGDIDDLSDGPEKRPKKRPRLQAIALIPDEPRVVFSSNCIVQTRRKTIKTFKDLNCDVVEDIEHADILCIPDGPMRRTTKFVLAIALGKKIVNESWVVECARQQKILAIDGFIPKDRTREEQWNFSISETMRRDPSHNGTVLNGWMVYTTSQLTETLGDLQGDFIKIAKALGVEKLQRGLPNKSADRGRTLVLGDDNDAHLVLVKQMGFYLHRKDALVLAALRGYYDPTSKEFRF